MDERYGRRYEDDERRFEEPRDYGDEGRRYRGASGYGRGWDRRDRGFFDRAGDEVRSWFGDEEAERRRREDERQGRFRGGPSTRWGEREERGGGDRDSRERDRERAWDRGASDDFDDRRWAEQWGYVDGPYGRRMGGGTGRGEERWGERRDEAWIARGPYSGRGPKGYRRSDERIREDVCDLLCEHGALDASAVEVQVVSGEVTLIGMVPTRGQKRLAEDLTDTVSGVNEVHNQLRVNQPTAPPQPGTAGSPAGQQDWRNRAA